jgi:hypothetical protein
MKTVTIAFALSIVLSTGGVFAHSHKHRHHMHRGSAAISDPNGTAGGPTSVSGTGSSKFGGQIPGSPRATRQ